MSTLENNTAELQEILNTVNELPSGGTSTVPYFDLTVMGLPTLQMDGTLSTVTVDCTEIREAFSKGLVKAKFNLNFAGNVIPIVAINCASYTAAMDNYQVCVLSHTTLSGKRYYHVIYLNFYANKIEARMDMLLEKSS